MYLFCVGDINVGIPFDGNQPSSFNYLCINIHHDFSRQIHLGGIDLINNTTKYSLNFLVFMLFQGCQTWYSRSKDSTHFNFPMFWRGAAAHRLSRHRTWLWCPSYLILVAQPHWWAHGKMETKIKCFFRAVTGPNSQYGFFIWHLLFLFCLHGLWQHPYPFSSLVWVTASPRVLVVYDYETGNVPL